MRRAPWWPRRWRGLGAKLFLSYLAVVLVGTITLLLAADLVAPTFFADHMARMMTDQRAGAMMGGDALGASPDEAMEALLTASFHAALAQALLVAGGAAILTALAASLVITDRVVGPVRRLVLASRRLADGHYAERVPAGSRDELGELATSFNALADALESTERRRLELVGDVAHELRTPVATIEGYLEGLLDGVVEPNERTWAKLHDEAGRLRRLINELQELSRAEARQIQLDPQPVDPADIAQAAIDRLTGQFDEKGLSFTTEIAAGLPAVRADRDRAIQVLTNLLTNALRHTPAPGSVRLTVRRRGRDVQFSLTDSGIGIAAEHLPHVFERFFRVDKSRSRALGGSGIGLTIARALVEAMGGRIWAESDGLGRGATFTFSVPIAH